MLDFDPQSHSYVEHPTYTGSDCAICGRHFAEHASAIFTETMTRAEALRRYPHLRGAQRHEPKEKALDGGSKESVREN